MKKLFVLSAFAFFAFASSAQQSAMEAWKPLLDKPQIAEYFGGLFGYLGVKVTDTGEELTVHHLGKSFELSKGLDPKADFTIEITSANVANMVKHGMDGLVDAAESFRIQSVLLTPLTRSDLNNPFLTNKRYLKLAKVETLTHVILLDPDKKQDYSQTLVYTGKEWIVVPGLHGKAQRTFRLTPEQALEFQRQLYSAKQVNTKKSWTGFMKWYNKWKTGVSTT